MRNKSLVINIINVNLGLLCWGYVFQYFLTFDWRNFSWPIIFNHLDYFINQYPNWNSNAPSHQSQLNDRRGVYDGLDLHRSVVLHCPVIVGVEQNHQHRYVANARTVVLGRLCEWQIHNRIEYKRHWNSDRHKCAVCIIAFDCTIKS